MLEAMHDDGHDYDGFRHDAGDGDLSPRHFHLRRAWDRSIDQISAFLISNFEVRGHRDLGFVRWRVNDMLAIDAAVRRTAAVAVTALQTLWRKGIVSCTFLVGLLTGAGLILQIH